MNTFTDIEINLIKLIDEDPYLNQTQLAEKLFTSQGNISKTLTKLGYKSENKKWIYVCPDEVDLQFNTLRFLSQIEPRIKILKSYSHPVANCDPIEDNTTSQIYIIKLFACEKYKLGIFNLIKDLVKFDISSSTLSYECITFELYTEKNFKYLKALLEEFSLSKIPRLLRREKVFSQIDAKLEE